MPGKALFNLSDVARVTDENPDLISFLVTYRDIPHTVVGRAKVVDRKGLATIKAELTAYRRKAGPIVPRPKRRRPAAAP